MLVLFLKARGGRRGGPWIMRRKLERGVSEVFRGLKRYVEDARSLDGWEPSAPPQR